jgi:hypothetical protein
MCETLVIHDRANGPCSRTTGSSEEGESMMLNTKTESGCPHANCLSTLVNNAVVVWYQHHAIGK